MRKEEDCSGGICMRTNVEFVRRERLDVSAVTNSHFHKIQIAHMYTFFVSVYDSYLIAVRSQLTICLQRSGLYCINGL